MAWVPVQGLWLEYPCKDYGLSTHEQEYGSTTLEKDYGLSALKGLWLEYPAMIMVWVSLKRIMVRVPCEDYGLSSPGKDYGSSTLE